MAAEIEILKKRVLEAEQYKARLKMLEEASFEAVTVFDSDLKCIDTNSLTTKLFQYSKEEILGMSGVQFFAPEFREQIQQNVSMGISQPYEALMQRKDGT